LVELADTLVDDFDVVDLLTLVADRCVEVLDVAAAGLMLAYPGGELRVMASSSHTKRLLELFELQSEEGPCPDCYRSGDPIVNHRLATVDGRWPRFGPRAMAAGFESVHALPMRLRGGVIGALNLFRADEGALSDADVHAAQAHADVATIAQRAAADTQLVNEQLHRVLNTRIVVEQAKGMVAEVAGVGLDQAFSALRYHARRHNLRLLDVAHDVIAGTLAAHSLDPEVPASRPEATAVASADPDVAGQRRAEILGLLGEMAADTGQADGFTGSETLQAVPGLSAAISSLEALQKRPISGLMCASGIALGVVLRHQVAGVAMADGSDAGSAGPQIGRPAKVGVRHLRVNGGVVHIKAIVGLGVHLTPCRGYWLLGHHRRTVPET
jgi:hypothetical protein